MPCCRTRDRIKFEKQRIDQSFQQTGNPHSELAVHADSSGKRLTKAEIKTTTLMTEGSPAIPACSTAMTQGEAAVPDPVRSCSFSEDTVIPITKTPC